MVDQLRCTFLQQFVHTLYREAARSPAATARLSACSCTCKQITPQRQSATQLRHLKAHKQRHSPHKGLMMRASGYLTFTRSAGTATICPNAPAVSPISNLLPKGCVPSWPPGHLLRRCSYTDMRVPAVHAGSINPAQLVMMHAQQLTPAASHAGTYRCKKSALQLQG